MKAGSVGWVGLHEVEDNSEGTYRARIRGRGTRRACRKYDRAIGRRIAGRAQLAGQGTRHRPGVGPGGDVPAVTRGRAFCLDRGRAEDDVARRFDADVAACAACARRRGLDGLIRRADGSCLRHDGDEAAIVGVHADAAVGMHGVVIEGGAAGVTAA